jgi:hypothetical protein
MQSNSKPQKTWDERLLDFILNGFFFGLVVTVLDLAGVDLNWRTGVGVMILSLIVAAISVIVGAVVYAVRLRRKSNG